MDMNVFPKVVSTAGTESPLRVTHGHIRNHLNKHTTQVIQIMTLLLAIPRNVVPVAISVTVGNFPICRKHARVSYFLCQFINYC